MSGRFDRNAMRSGLRQRSEESYSRVDAQPNSSKNILKSKPGVKMFGSMPEGINLFSIIPFMGGKHVPTQLNFGGTGAPMPYLEVFAHTYVGAGKDAFVCPQANYGKPCPMCQHYEKLRSQWPDPTEEQKKVLGKVRAKRRVVYNVVDERNRETQGKGVQIFEISHFQFQKNIEPLTLGVNGDIEIFYADPDEGYFVRCNRSGTGMGTEYNGFMLQPRDWAVPDEWLEAAETLDELLELPLTDDGEINHKEQYDRIYSAFHGVDVEEADDNDTAPVDNGPVAPAALASPAAPTQTAAPEPAVAEPSAPAAPTQTAAPEPAVAEPATSAPPATSRRRRTTAVSEPAATTETTAAPQAAEPQPAAAEPTPPAAASAPAEPSAPADNAAPAATTTRRRRRA